MPILLTNETTNDHGGIQRYVARLATTFVDLKRNVTLIEPLSQNGRKWTGVRTVCYSNVGRLLSMGSALLAYMRVAKSPFREPTIASIWFPSGFVAALVPSMCRGKLAILAHGSEICPGRGGIRRSLMCWTFSQADVVIANSNFTRQLLCSAGVRAQTVVIPCGVDAKRVEGRRSSEPRVLSVGRLIARKGFDRLIEAMPEILKEVPGTRLRIVGEGPMRDSLAAVARQLRVSENVDFLGALEDFDLEAEYGAAWCFAMPCRRIVDDVEGFGIVYLEAAMAELPSIGGLESGAEDAILDGVTGTLVDGNSPTAIASAISVYLTNPHLSSTTGVRARARALAEFSWPRIAMAIESAVGSGKA